MAEQGLSEVGEDKPALEEELSAAKYELDRANNRYEYEERRAIYDEVNDRMTQLNEKEHIAQEAFDSLSEDISGLREAYEQATEGREHWVNEIQEKANITVDEYDPRNGPPELPSEGEDEGETTGEDTTGEGEAAAANNE